MSIYRLLIHRFAVPLPSQGKAHEETQQPAKPQFVRYCPISSLSLFFRFARTLLQIIPTVAPMQKAV